MALMLGKTRAIQFRHSLDNTLDRITRGEIVTSISTFRNVYSKIDMWANETMIGANTKQELDKVINGVAALNELSSRLSDSVRNYVDKQEQLWQNNSKWDDTSITGLKVD